LPDRLFACKPPGSGGGQLVQEEQRGLAPEQQKIYVAIWEKAIDTQMHFNEMSVKARQFGLTFVAAALGLGVVILSRGPDFVFHVNHFGGFDLHGVVLLVFASAFALFAVSILDLDVYHRMLRGAVTFGEDFEENYMKQIFQLEKGMTQAISHYSRYSDAHVNRSELKYRYCGMDLKSAERKVRRFYTFSIVTLFVLAVLLFVVTGNFGGLHTPVSSIDAAGSAIGDKGPTNAR
jgi:hypothetical protein